MTINTPRILEIHTSDRVGFKRCRRRWGWQSQLRGNLVPSVGETAAPLWFGSGFHFALEDYHGYNRFGNPALAFEAYSEATRGQRPSDYEEHEKLARGMLRYYTRRWEPRHKGSYQTLWVDGKPQCEVDIKLDITEFVLNRAGRAYRQMFYDIYGSDAEIVYSITFDRVVVDEHDRIWGVDYKTAKRMESGNLELNPQATSYSWVMWKFYDQEPEGILWHQFLKAVPDAPQKLANGHLSVNKNQKVTYSSYRAALKMHYAAKGIGVPWRQYTEFLNHLAYIESEEGDEFIQLHPIRRNAAMRAAEEEKIAYEVMDMLDPNLPLYPNPTRDCNWDCNFRAACLGLDDGSDIAYMLATEYTQWQGYRDDWRARITYPEVQVTE